jgi:2-dehydro-3-deoxygalactonokinase
MSGECISFLAVIYQKKEFNLMNELIAIVDMGTSNTRLFLTDGTGKILASVQDKFGVKDRAITGSRDVLLSGLRKLLSKAAREANIKEEQIECFFCSGMISSEIGLTEIPHCSAPVSIGDLARQAHEESFPEILPVPFYFIPGVKNRVKKTSMEALDDMDFMRGEETQVFGAIELFEIKAPVTFIFLSSHTKLVDVDEGFRITKSFTTLSGQIFNSLRYQTMLASSICAQDPFYIDEKCLFHGVEAGLRNGILRSGLLIRFMDTLIATTPEDRFAFLEGIISASDIKAIKMNDPNIRERVVVLGKPLRANAYIAVFKKYLDGSPEYKYLGEKSMEQSALQGALKIARMRTAGF